jgi:CRISPR-associated protein Cas1
VATLYVTEPGARIEKEYQRLLVIKDDEVLLRVPLQRVSGVVLVGRAGVTTPALHALLNAGVPLLLVSRNGKTLGCLQPPTAANLPLRQAQYRCNDDTTFSLKLAKYIVAGKIRNQRVLAQRLARRHPHIQANAVFEEMRNAIQAAQKAETMEVLLGIEGQAARRYFYLFRQAFDPAWTFSKRTRRPPKDPVNAVLSLGYTFLGHALQSALETVGLDPYLGYFHAEKYGRPALVLDLLEEFRAPVVDSLTLSLINHHLLDIDDFEPDPESGGVYLSSRGLRVFLAQFSRRLESQVTPRSLGRTISYRKLFEVQARKLTRLIQGKIDEYKPFQAR